MTDREYHETLALGVDMLVRQPQAFHLSPEAVDARRWFARICRGDFAAAARVFTRTDDVEVWTIRWTGHMVVGEAGEPLSSLMLRAMQADREANPRAD